MVSIVGLTTSHDFQLSLHSFAALPRCITFLRNLLQLSPRVQDRQVAMVTVPWKLLLVRENVEMDGSWLRESLKKLTGWDTQNGGFGKGNYVNYVKKVAICGMYVRFLGCNDPLINKLFPGTGGCWRGAINRNDVVIVILLVKCVFFKEGGLTA